MSLILLISDTLHFSRTFPDFLDERFSGRSFLNNKPGHKITGSELGYSVTGYLVQSYRGIYNAKYCGSGNGFKMRFEE